MWRIGVVFAVVTLICACVPEPAGSTEPTAGLPQAYQSGDPALPTADPARATDFPSPPSVAPTVTGQPSTPPTARPAPTENPTRTVGPTPTAEQTRADGAGSKFSWERVGDVGSSIAVAGVTEGYVTLRASTSGEGKRGGTLASTQFSADGTVWSEPVSFGEIIEPCPTWAPRPSLYLYSLYSSGSSVVTFGMEDDTDCSTDASAESSVGFVSSDGRSWQRMATPITPGIGTSVWPVDGGWEAVVAENDDDSAPGRSVIYRSPDGSAWDPAGELGVEFAAYDFSGPLTHGGVGLDGTRLVIVSEYVEDNDAMHVTLWTSRDGAVWESIESPFTGIYEWSLERDLPYGAALTSPTGLLPFWTVAIETESGGATIWTTNDLVDWQDAPFPRPTITKLTSTSAGLIADGRVPCVVAGSPCPPPRQAQFVSNDGLTWAQLEPRLVGEFDIADGPFGPMVIGANTGRVWLLRVNYPG